VSIIPGRVLQAAVESFDGENYSCIKMLLDHGADINAPNNSEETVLYAALNTVNEGNYDGVNMLLDQGADINAVCDAGKTVLHAAFEDPDYFPEVEVIQLLLTPTREIRNKKTSLYYAVRRSGPDELDKILFDATVHDQLMSTDYVTFLYYAVYDGNCVGVKLFLELGLDLDKIDVNNAEYPLYFAVENEHLRCNLLLRMTKIIGDYKRHYEKFPT
jgi:ankyrin repeat protein